MPQLPPGSPFEEFFEEFFKNRRGPGRRAAPDSRAPRRVNSLGSGFIIDPSGLVVTNNHVIADADEITVIFNDGTKLKAEIDRQRSEDRSRAAQGEAEQAAQGGEVRRLRQLRIGEWVIAIGNPFGLGGTVTAGIVSARNRDINSGPYDNYIQTDASINRGNSGGPLFNMDGEVIGINTAIISPSGGSIGIGFAVPSKTAVAVIDQLRQFGETRRGWLGVRIQQVTDDIAESLSIKPTRGALVAGVDDKGPAKPAGIEPGDVIVKFDGKDIKEMRDLPRIVAETPVGKDVEVIIIRKGKEETKTVTLGRLEDGEKQQAASPKRRRRMKTGRSQEGARARSLQSHRRAAQQLQDQGHGEGRGDHRVEANSAAAEKRFSAGEVIVEVRRSRSPTPTRCRSASTQLKKEGKKSALLLVANARRRAALRRAVAAVRDARATRRRRRRCEVVRAGVPALPPARFAMRRHPPTNPPAGIPARRAAP